MTCGQLCVVIHNSAHAHTDHSQEIVSRFLAVQHGDACWLHIRRHTGSGLSSVDAGRGLQRWVNVGKSDVTDIEFMLPDVSFQGNQSDLNVYGLTGCCATSAPTDIEDLNEWAGEHRDSSVSFALTNILKRVLPHVCYEGRQLCCR